MALYPLSTFDKKKILQKSDSSLCPQALSHIVSHAWAVGHIVHVYINTCASVYIFHFYTCKQTLIRAHTYVSLKCMHVFTRNLKMKDHMANIFLKNSTGFVVGCTMIYENQNLIICNLYPKKESG